LILVSANWKQFTVILTASQSRFISYLCKAKKAVKHNGLCFNFIIEPLTCELFSIEFYGIQFQEWNLGEKVQSLEECFRKNGALELLCSKSLEDPTIDTRDQQLLGLSL